MSQPDSASRHAGDLPRGPGVPTAPIPLAGGAAEARSRRRGSHVGVTPTVLAELRDVCAEVTDEPAVTAEASRDWWPLAMTWALRGEVPARAAAVARPRTPEEVAAVLAVCNRRGVPVTAAGGRSGVCGASVPLYGGVVLDLCELRGIRAVDADSLVVDVLPGTFGDRFEAELRAEHGLTCGHWPQSMTLSTVGGWLACRGAGQLSTRYGKIEDMVVGLDVALADGRTIHTGGFPRSATGPDLTQVFVGSEGTLGVITGARLKLHPLPAHEARATYSVESFAAGLDLCRRILQRGGTPAVLRLYDEIESKRNYATADGQHVLIVLDEGDPLLVDATMVLVRDEAERSGARSLDDDLVAQWLTKRNDVSALERLISDGLVVDTMEVSGPWSSLPALYDAAIAAIGAVTGTLAVSAHCSHSYRDGACVYFTFAGTPAAHGEDAEAAERYYRAAWDAGTRAVLAAGGSLSHHHGVGLNRSRYVAEALGAANDMLAALKGALDPQGILNPGKLGLASRFGTPNLP